jgi:hypothetical protein
LRLLYLLGFGISVFAFAMGVAQYWLWVWELRTGMPMDWWDSPFDLYHIAWPNSNDMVFTLVVVPVFFIALFAYLLGHAGREI